MQTEIPVQGGKLSRGRTTITKEIRNYSVEQNASFETLDCEVRGISRDVIVNLPSMGFVSTATNLIINP